MDVIFDNFGYFLGGIGVTLALALTGFVGASVVGLFVGCCRLSPVPSLRAFATTYVELLRNLPITVILVFLFFAMPEVKITLSAFMAAAVGLSLYFGTYIAEAIRSGVNAVPVGHIEAARALGMNYTVMLRRVVLPEALRIMIAPFGNVFVDLTKATSVATTISVMEITGRTNDLVSRYSQAALIFAAAGVAYLLLTIPLGLAFRALDAKMAIVR